MDALNPLDYKISEMSKLLPMRGRILIAEPFMADPYFRRAVVLLIEHNNEGTFGFILNKPMSLTINDTLFNFPDFDADVFMGGPVQPENLFFLHTLGSELGDAEEVLPGLYWGGDFDTVKAGIMSGKVQKKDIRFFVGYAGWGEGQLEEEIAAESWLVSETTAEDLMLPDTGKIWPHCLKQMGKQHSILANFPEDPALN